MDEFLEREHALTGLGRDGIMAKAIEGSNLLIGLGRVSANARGTAASGVLRKSAPVLGLVVRSIKLYEGIVQHLCNRQGELAQVLFRPLMETVAYAEYLMRRPARVAREFIEISYRPEMRIIDELAGIERERPLLPIEARMLSSARRHLRSVGLSHLRLKRRKNWKLDNRDMAAICTEIQWGKGYVFGYMSGSHWSHGTWYDLIVNHLRRSGRRYYTRMSYSTPTPGHITPASLLVLSALRSFEERYPNRATRGLPKRVERLGDFFILIDGAWERLQQDGK